MHDYANLNLFMAFGLVFGSLAAMMAFLITHEEYSRHHFPRRQLLKASLEAAGVSFMAIFLLAVVIGYLLGGLTE